MEGWKDGRMEGVDGIDVWTEWTVHFSPRQLARRSGSTELTEVLGEGGPFRPVEVFLLALPKKVRCHFDRAAVAEDSPVTGFRDRLQGCLGPGTNRRFRSARRNFGVSGIR